MEVRLLSQVDDILIWSTHDSPAFRQNPMKNIELFIKGHGEFIEESGGLNGLIKLLLVSSVIMLHPSMLNITTLKTFKFHGHITQREVYELSQEYQELCRSVPASPMYSTE
jgi:hypothetical protein